MTAREYVAEHMMMHNGINLKDLDILSTPGYWAKKAGGRGTYTCIDWGARSSIGTFISPYWAWKELWEKTNGTHE